jgi:DNA topoisomerase VI subunit B
MDEMVASVKGAIQACCNQLKVKITRQLAAKEQKLRRKNLTKYIPNAANAIFKVSLSRMAMAFCQLS